jgi:excisionase family DNA binding protein
VLLYTPAQAAALLQVPESWLRRRAAQRRVACTFLGKHLRFSRADLDAIVATASTGSVTRPPLLLTRRRGRGIAESARRHGSRRVSVARMTPYRLPFALIRAWMRRAVGTAANDD